MKYSIGDRVQDEDGCKGMVGILYADGDFVFMPNGQDAAHPNPQIRDIDRITEMDGIDLDPVCEHCDERDATEPEGLCKVCDRKLEIDKKTEGSL